jgi:Ca-activated chloride channel family protein
MSLRNIILVFLLAGVPLILHAEQIKLKVQPGQSLLAAGEVQTTFIKIGLEGLPVAPAKQRPPINVALVLDRSGSMSGEKINQAKAAAHKALDYLQPEDTLALVIYDDQVEVLVPSSPFRDRQHFERAIDSIQVNGRTALYGGVSKGAEELRKFVKENRVNRLILLSDGLANVGPSTPAELGELGRQLGAEGMSVTTIGLGLGYNEDLMVRLAGASDGNHAFVEKPEQLAEVFANEFGELVSVVAKDVIIIIHCQNGVKPLRALGREAKIEGARVEARLNQLYARQEKYLLLEVEVPAGSAGADKDLANVELRYDDLHTRREEKQATAVRIAYTDAAEKAKSSVDKTVMIAASEQIGVEMDEQAVQLKDKGDTDGARKMLREKAAYLDRQAERYESKKLKEQSEQSLQAEEAAAAPVGSSDWNKARKNMRADQYSIKKQQSYK